MAIKTIQLMLLVVAMSVYSHLFASAEFMEKQSPDAISWRGCAKLAAGFGVGYLWYWSGLKEACRESSKENVLICDLAGTTLQIAFVIVGFAVYSAYQDFKYAAHEYLSDGENVINLGG